MTLSLLKVMLRSIQVGFSHNHGTTIPTAPLASHVGLSEESFFGLRPHTLSLAIAYASLEL